MKQILLTLLSITTFSFNQFAQDGLKKPATNNNANKTIIHRPHKSLNYSWSGSSWVFIDSSDYVYNIQGQTTNSMSQNGNYYTERITSNYDNLFQPTLEIKEDYDHVNATWRPGIKHQIDYNGLQDIILDERYLFESGSWELWIGTKNTYQYDSNNRISEIVEFAYNEFEQVYRENLKFSDIVYDTNNNILERIISVWNQNQWKYEEKQINTYHADNTIDTQYVYQWNENTNSWKNYYRCIYTHGANGSYEYLIESYSSNTWILSGRHGVNFDSYGNRTRYFTESWDEMSNQLVLIEDFVDNYLYDMNDYLIQHIHQEITSSPQAENIYRKDYYDFEAFDSQLDVESSEENTVTIYPNPMESQCTIDLSKLNAEVKSIGIYDLAGNLISELAVTANQKIPFSKDNLTQGIYFIEIRLDQTNIRSKIMVK
jgi:hypothetical protein